MMMKNKIFVISGISAAFFIILVLLFGILHIGWGKEGKASQLQTFLEKTLQENQQLKDAILQAEKKVNSLNLLLREKEQEIQVLGNTQLLKQALTSAQATVTQLSKEVEQTKAEKIVLQENNLTVNSRLQRLTQELTSALEDLKAAKQELAEAKKRNIQQAAPVILENKPNLDLAQKEKQIKSLQEELAKLNANKLSLEEQFNKKDKYIQELNLLNQNLKNQIVQLPSDVSQKDLQLAKQNKELAKLRDELFQSQAKLSHLQNEAASRENELSRVRNEFARAKAPSFDESLFRQQIEDTKRLYENAKGQIVQLSEILGGKEIELNNQRKEAAELKNEAAELKEKLAGLNNELAAVHSDSQKIKILESEKLSLQAQYLQAQADLRKQNEVIASLTNALDALNKKITQAQEEKKNLEMSLTQDNLTRGSLEGELDKQKKRVDELNDFYSGLKNQIVQFSNLLTDKESELNQSQKEMLSLKNELLYQQTRVTNLEKELSETKERHKKIFENLSQATNLNTALQQSLSGAAQSIEQKEDSSDYKQKAEELRRKIEVILSPENSP